MFVLTRQAQRVRHRRMSGKYFISLSLWFGLGSRWGWEKIRLENESKVSYFDTADGDSMVPVIKIMTVKLTMKDLGGLTHNHSVGTILISTRWHIHFVEVTKLTWPEVTDIKTNPRYTSCMHLLPYETLNVLNQTNEECGHCAASKSETRFLLWPDLVTWPLVTWG